MVQSQLDRPVSVPATYPSVAGQLVQAMSPDKEKELAAQGVHTVLELAVHTPPKPASHVLHGTQFVLPSPLQVIPAWHWPRTITARSAAAAAASGSRRGGAIRGGTGEGAGEAGGRPLKKSR